MRHTDKSREKREILTAITTGNNSPVGALAVEGDVYQNCTINIQTFLLFADQGQTSPQRRLIMEKEKNEEIIAYRIRESLYCPDCYEKSARDLKAVQNPEDPEVKFPSKPITAGDISIFICEDCKTIGGHSAADVKAQKPKDALDVEDMVIVCLSKIQFLIDFFTHNVPLDELFSKNGVLGFYWNLSDLRDDLEVVSAELSKKNQKSLAIEKTGGRPNAS